MSELEGEKQDELTPEQIRELLQALDKIERLEMIVAELNKIIQEKTEKGAQDEQHD